MGIQSFSFTLKKMQAIVLFGFLGVLQLAACSVEHPPLTRCSGSDYSIAEIESITATDANLGEEVIVSAKVLVKQPAGTDTTTLEITFTTSDGTPLPCVNYVVPKEMKVCGGTTEFEQQMGAEWNNVCPVAPGEYTARLTFSLPAGQLSNWCLGDGNVIATVHLKEDGQTVDCVSFPFKVRMS